MFGQTEEQTVKTDVVQYIIGQKVEAWIENEVSEEDIEAMVEKIYQLLDNPISLNSDDLSELVEIQLLTDFQVATIKKYRKQHGDIQTIWEISLLPDFEMNEIETLIPFVNFETEVERKTVKQRLRYFKNEILSEYKRNMETADGYISKNGKSRAYKGSPDKLYLRYTIKSGNNFSAGITSKKDPGEPFFTEPRKEGFDFYSAHAYLNLQRTVKEIFIGDFTANFGNGLTIGNNIMSRKGPDAINIKSNATRLRKYSSSREYGFFRGAGITLQHKNLRGILFASHNKIDATVAPFEDTYRIVSLPQTGNHRTENELKQRKAAEESVVGANITYRGENFSIGANSYALKYNYPYVPATALYRIHNPNTDTYINSSVDYQYMKNSVILWGEAAIDKNMNPSFIQGLQLKTTDISRMAILYRNYSSAYYSPLATAFGEGSDGSNEKGLYAGMSFYPFSTIEINAFADLFSFPWLKYSRSSLTEGVDYMTDITWRPKRYVKISSRVRYKETLYNIVSDSITVQTLGTQETIRAHLQLEYEASKQWSAKTRIASCFFDNYKGSLSGWALIQDITCNLPKFPLRLTARYAIFNTESYDTRIYVYENDVLYALSVPALYGQGMRYYLVVTWKYSRNLSVYLKWSQTIMQNVTELSSGNDRIDGNTRSQITIKAKYTF
jgi:hypothetical protein